jgi:hypothetical protein
MSLVKCMPERKQQLPTDVTIGEIVQNGQVLVLEPRVDEIMG